MNTELDIGFFQNYARLVGMKITLAVTERDESTTLGALRASGKIPAVVYGPKQTPVNIVIGENEFDKIRKESGESTVIELVGLKDSIEVLMKAVEFNPVKNKVMHVDFYALELGKEITTNVQLQFVGESPAEQKSGLVLAKVINEVEVTCKPNVLPGHIDVDISSLVEADNKIMIKDLIVDKAVKIGADQEDIVVIVKEKKESVEEDESTSVDMDAIEVEQKGKGEEVEG